MKKGFTLIELLVVIAIIAILAAILFPVFAQAREKARAITCVSNEKQMGLAIIQYLQDNDEFFPFLQYYDVTDTVPIDWNDAIYPYIKNGQNQTPGAKASVTTHNGQGGIWACPSFPIPTEAEYGINWELARDGTGTWGAKYAATSGWTLIQVSDASVTTPSDTMLVAEHGNAPENAGNSPGNNYNQALIDPGESNYTSADLWPLSNGEPTGVDNHVEVTWDFDCGATSSASNCATWAGPGCEPRYRHTNEANLLFVDGHVKPFRRGTINWFNNIYIPGIYESLDGTPS